MCGLKFPASEAFRLKSGKAVQGVEPPAQAPAQPTVRGWLNGWRVGKWLIVVVIVFLILVIPVFPRVTVVYVDGTTQTVTNEVQYSTVFQAYTITTTSQINVYSGTYQYFANYTPNYYYASCTFCCYWFWYTHQLICNYAYWPWYKPSYGTTVTITPGEGVVSVTRTPQSGYLETLTLTYYNGQSTTIQNVYNDHLSQSGTMTVKGNSFLTSTVTDTITTPVTLAVPCHQCAPENVTERVSLLQLLFGY